MLTKDQIFSRISPLDWINSMRPLLPEELPYKIAEFLRMPESERKRKYKDTGKTFEELFRAKPAVRAYYNRKWEIERKNVANFESIMNLKAYVVDDPDLYQKFIDKAVEFRKVIIANTDPFVACMIDFGKYPELPKMLEDELVHDFNQGASSA